MVISRFGALFFGQPVAAFTNLARALRRRGRVALLAWQGLARNDWVLAIRESLAAGRSLAEPPAGAPGPFGLADSDDVHRVLTDAGFVDIELSDVREPMFLGSDTDDAFSFVAGLGLTRGLTAGLDPETRDAALDTLRRRLARQETADGVLLNGAAWLITARRG